MTKKQDGKPLPKSPQTLTIICKECEDRQHAEANALIGPFVINAFALANFGQGSLGELSMDSVVTALVEGSKKLNANDLDQVEATLFSQATALNVIFGELTLRAARNLNGGSEYRIAMEAYFKMALKAQNQCRMTLETLGNIKNPPIVYAKQTNIANGPQQVNNGSMPHAPANETETEPSKILEQSNEQRLDAGTQSPAFSGNPPVEAVAEGNRS